MIKKQPTILVINGANLNMLGKRDPVLYGKKTLDEINAEIYDLAAENGLYAEFFQSNHEGDIIDKIQAFNGDAIIINAGAYSHYSHAIADALEIKDCIKVEVHLSDIKAREEFRRHSVITRTCNTMICGKKEQGYFEAVQYIYDLLNKNGSR